MRRRIPSWAVLLWMAALIVPPVVLALHTGWLFTVLWILGPVALIGAVFAFVVLCCPALALVAVHERFTALGLACLVLILGVAAPVVLVLSPDLRVRARFYVERSAFGSVVELARQGRLASDEYYGARLPGPLCFVSATCGVVTWTAGDGQPVLFVPDWVGIPDDAVGYAHFTGPPGGSYDGFGLRICPRLELADGWWWLDACPRDG
ncbi:hypothetical protein [Nonomuraea sp. NPDC050643]|uniref:hypothetical protein n=1 Tax=Nonomuraea sp. NPDC050643 TaxID=3155660 RepID=UPI0033C30D87